MPCNTRITVTVELGLKTDSALLLKALQAQFGAVDHNIAVPDVAKRWFRFYSGSYPVTIDAGKLKSTMDQGQLEKVAGLVKQSYAVEAMRASAKRFGWAMQEEKQGPTVTRRA